MTDQNEVKRNYKPLTLMVPMEDIKWLTANVKSSTLSVYMAMNIFADFSSRECYPSINRIAKQANVSRATAVKGIADLESIGVITKQHRFTYDEDGDQVAQTSNLYLVNRVPESIRVDAKSKLPSTEYIPTPGTESIRPQSGIYTQSSTNEIEPIEVEPNTEKGVSGETPSEDEIALTGLQSSFQKPKQKNLKGPGPRAAKDNPGIWAMVTAYNDARGLPDHKVPAGERSTAYTIFSQLPRGYGEQDVAGCTRYLASQQWYQEPGRLTAKAVTKTVMEWVAKGRPEMEAPRGAASGAGRMAGTLGNLSEFLKEQGQ